ncbi:alanyl-tRNA synthetase [Phycomyces blakesleeanus]|uniref:Alanine--tRNA ligase n=1 Tax=Phycomyces blakesleeanus TaxID=4837 RepID=A0ABR3B5Q5_PHYBL
MYLTRLHLAQARHRTSWTQRRLIQQLTSPELRARFLNYFETQQHVPIKSASLVPHNDKSLLFTNAGMVPFKDFFLKPDTAPFKAATSVQKCMRAGGKHNDLDNVGYTARHHTFFEMLGNFSFGQYTKKEAIRYAWRFLVDELKLPLSRLRVTILEGDEEGYKLWKNEGLSDDMIVRCGEEDNFWSMGDGEGPCGPCTEIFWDTQDDTLDERWLEIWNLVFMENYREADGKLTKLPIPCIDTGMGLERMVCVLQGKNNNFQIDQFETLIGGLRQVMKTRGIESISSVDPNPHEKIIADHFRAMCFLIGDGVVPSNVGRGYVLRRIIRRALRSARQLGIHEPFLTDLYPHLLAGFEDGSYPELTSRASSIRSVVTNEERSFLATLDRGMALLENVFSQPDLQGSKAIPPAIAFQLYDTFGFPFDLTLIIAKEKGWTVDIKAVEALQEQQKQLGRESWKVDAITNKARLAEWRNKNIMPKFSGYDRSMLHQTSEIVAVEPVMEGKKMTVNIAIDPCPFYGLGGGQVADSGYITLANGQRWDVTDVFQPYDGCLALKLTPANIAKDETIESLIKRDQEFFQIGQQIDATVNIENRQGAEVHHTATHVLNAGLRSVLKTDIVQAGSTVETQKLRFDFTYGKPLTPSQLHSIEEWVNEAALNGGAMSVKHMKLADAMKMGAVATFSEKYGEDVRVVEVEGVSKELCGGTHVDDIRKLYPFKILTETSVAAGTRRIEAVAGLSCVKWYRKAYEPVPEVLKMLRANTTDEMVGKLDKSMQQTKDLQKRLDFMTEKLASAGEVIVPPVESTMKDIPVKIHLVDPELDASYMQKRANVLKESQPCSAHILVNGNNIVVALDAKKIKQETANTILRHVLKHVKGGGGGQKEYAQGRIAEPIRDIEAIESKIVAALQKV